MQCRWNAWLQTPHAATHSLSVSVIAMGWHSMHGSIMWFRQIAQLSTAISQDQNATAVHFLISNFLCFGFGVFSTTVGSEPSGVTSMFSTSLISYAQKSFLNQSSVLFLLVVICLLNLEYFKGEFHQTHLIETITKSKSRERTN